MKQIAVYSLLIVMLVIAGCPVLTKNSIDNGSYDTPSWLTGKWYETDKDGKMKDSGYMLEKDSPKGILKCYDIDASGNINRTTSRSVILSSVNKKIYMSVYNPADDMSEEGYYLFELRKVSNSEFVLAGIKEHVIDYDATPEEIKKYLEKNKDNTTIFDPADASTYKKK